MKIVADENIAELESYFAAFGSLNKLPGRAIDYRSVRDADVLLVRSVTRVDKSLLQGSSVRFVASATIGVDHVDQRWLKAQGIGFCSAPGCNATAVADYDLLTLLEAEASLLESAPSFRLADRTLAIVGYGHVGKAVEARLKPYFASVVACDPPLAKRGQAGLVSYDQALEQDVICFHTPLIYEGEYPSVHLLNRARIDKLAPGSILLNAGRGGVIDEMALLDRLQRQKDLTVILDVWEGEPTINQSLLDEVFIGTPHIAGYSVMGKHRGTQMIHAEFCEFFSVAVDDAHCPDSVSHSGGEEGEAIGANKSGSIGLPAVRSVNALRELYDIRQDHHDLLKARTLEARAVGDYFDQLRKNYLLRPDL